MKGTPFVFRIWDAFAAMPVHAMPPTHRAVLLAVGKHAGPGGAHAFPSIATLRRLTGLGTSTIVDALQELVDRRWLEREPRRDPSTGGTTSNLYNVRLDGDPWSEDEAAKRHRAPPPRRPMPPDGEAPEHRPAVAPSPPDGGNPSRTAVAPSPPGANDLPVILPFDPPVIVARAPEQIGLDLGAPPATPPAPPAPTRKKRTRGTREDITPEQLTDAERRVHGAIVGDPDLAAITREPGWLARDLVASAPLVDVVLEVRALGAYLRQNRKRYTDGNAYLLRNIARKQREAAERGAPPPATAAPPRDVRPAGPPRTPPVPGHIARAAERDLAEGRVPAVGDIMATLDKLSVGATGDAA